MKSKGEELKNWADRIGEEVSDAIVGNLDANGLEIHISCEAGGVAQISIQPKFCVMVSKNGQRFGKREWKA